MCQDYFIIILKLSFLLQCIWRHSRHGWASLVAQPVKNPPAMWETWVWSLGWEDSPGKGKGYPFQYSGLENSMDCIVHGVTKSWTRLSLHFTSRHGCIQNVCFFKKHFPLGWELYSTKQFVFNCFDLDFPGGSEVKASALNAGDSGSIPGSGRSPEGNGNLPQDFCLENPMDGEAW